MVSGPSPPLHLQGGLAVLWLGWALWCSLHLLASRTWWVGVAAEDLTELIKTWRTSCGCYEQQPPRQVPREQCRKRTSVSSPGGSASSRQP